MSSAVACGETDSAVSSKNLGRYARFYVTVSKISILFFSLTERERRKKGNRLGWIHLKNEYATTIQVSKYFLLILNRLCKTFRTQRLYRGCRGRKIARTRWNALQKIQNFGKRFKRTTYGIKKAHHRYFQGKFGG